VTTRSGATHSHEILNRRGSPENPLSAGDVEYKFRNVVESCLSPSQINHVVDLVDEMDRKNNLSELILLLAAQRQV
jgi:2-methylcitrate dehydratase PrpD